MTIEQDMWSKIANALAATASNNLSSASAGNDLYEAYVWSLILEAARRENAAVTLLDRAGQPPTAFWFRTSPSDIFSAAHDYCHAQIDFPGCPSLEAHIGVFVSGKSRVNHEADVAVLYKDEADVCRRDAVHPRSAKVLLTAECKFYINSNVGVGLGRSFLGLINDIYSGNRFFIATRSSSSVLRLLSKHNKEYEIGLSPMYPDLEIRLRGAFEKTFRDFKAQYT